MEEKRIGLADAIRALRLELEESIWASEGEQLRFEVGEIELEFHVQVERSLTAKGVINIWVAQLGGEGARSWSNTHVVRVPLTPVNVNGPADKPVLTGPRGEPVPR